MQMMFRGRSSRNLDAKGRLMLSPEFRELLLSRSEEGRLVLTTYDDCVVAFPLPEWLIFEEKINALKNPTRQARDFRRLVLGGAEEMIPDGQGRIRLSRDHLDYAGIERDAVIMGQGLRFEIWSPERLQPVLNRDFNDVAESLAQSGLDFAF